MTSQISMPIASATILSSLTRAMLTRAEDVFDELGHFRDLGGGDGNDLLEGRAVEGDPGFQACSRVAADDFRDVGGGELGIAGILAFRGIDDEDLGADLEAGGFDAGDDFLLGGAGVGGAFKAEDHSRQLKQEIAISLSARRFLRSDFTCLGSGS